MGVAIHVYLMHLLIVLVCSFNFYLCITVNSRSLSTNCSPIMVSQTSFATSRNTSPNLTAVGPELQSRVNNSCITFVQSPLSLVVIDDQSHTDSA